jgi:hypothetical protein
MMPDDITKRLRYFDQQFLTEKDFIDEQNYHLDRRRRHNRFCHTFGIADGLEVTKIDAKKVQVSPGTAIDINGREIVQDKDFTIDLSNATDFQPKSTVYITIQYQEFSSDSQNPDKPGTETRVSENSSINKSTKSPPTDGTVIQLAKFTLTDQGNVPDGRLVKEEKDRQTVGAVLADRSVSIQKLQTELKFDLTETLAIDKALEKMVFETYISEKEQPIGAFILVYASSKTEGAVFSWNQRYTTEKVNEQLVQRQYVIFTNDMPAGSKKEIQLTYKIYTVLEGS